MFCVVFFFFFKQKTAYEMRISDWSSDVCSSDLHRARQRSRDVDRGIDALFGELARQDDMTVDDRARAIDDGVVDVAAIGEHGIERGDRAAGFAVDAGAFAERRNEREDRGRIALHRRRLAERQPDLALSMRDAGKAVDPR